MPDCIFCKIAAKEIPSNVIWENEHFFAFLDVFPAQPGHLLIIPKQHVDSIFELSDEMYKAIFEVAKMLEAPLQRAMGAKRIGITVEGFGVPHAHVHLIPINKSHDMDSVHSKPAVPEELVVNAEKIKAELVK